MAAHVSVSLANGHTLTVVSVPMIDLALKPFVEYRLIERDAAGGFLGYCAMGSLEFCRSALANRTNKEGE